MIRLPRGELRAYLIGVFAGMFAMAVMIRPRTHVVVIGPPPDGDQLPN